MSQLAMEQRAAMLAEALQKMEVWDEQYKAFLGELKELARRNHDLAVKEHDPYKSGHKAGVAAAYRHMFDDLLSLYHDFLTIKKTVAAGVLGQPTT